METGALGEHSLNAILLSLIGHISRGNSISDKRLMHHYVDRFGLGDDIFHNKLKFVFQENETIWK